MKLRSKVLKTSLAATLVLGSVAGLPLSSKGLTEVIGAGKAYATGLSDLDSYHDQLDQMTSTEKEAILKAKNALKDLSEDDANLVQDLTDKINVVASQKSKQPIDSARILNLVAGLSELVYEPTSILTFIDENRTLLTELKELSGVAQTENIGFFHALEFINALQEKLGSGLAGKTLDDAKTKFSSVLVDVLDDGSVISDIITHLGLTANDLVTAVENVNGVADPNNDALKALIAFYSRLYPNSGGGGGGGGAPSSDIPSPDIKNATEVLNNVSSKLTELLNEGKGNGLARAVEAIENAIRKAANIDLSKVVKVEGGVAKLTLDVAKLDEVFKNVKEIAKLAKEKLAAVAPDAKPAKVIATLDLGTVDAKTAQIPLSKDLVAKAKENGIDALAINVNGISLTIDVDQLDKDTNVTIKQDEKTAAASVTKLTIASDVYEFTFESNGEKIESFTKPVEVRIPLPSTSEVDSELLVLTKLDNGKLVFKGGKYNAETKEFVALNKSFSTYAVIENKVTFNDIASVNDWAGRQIAVTAAKGIVEGRSEGQFVPGDKVTRAEFAKLIVKTFGLEDAAATESFGDVNDSDWFKPYVAAAVKAGLIQGRSDDKFEPNATITRAELATIASRALTKVRDYKGVDNADAALKAFADASDIHSSLKDGVALSADLGVVIGEDGGKFNPNNGSTRAQAAVVIYRLLNK